MSDPSCDRWITLSDRAAAGGELPAAEREWLAEHAKCCSECGGESQFWSQLGSVMEQPEILNETLALQTSAPARPNAKGGTSRFRSRYGWVLGLAAGVALTLSTAWLLRERQVPSVAVAEVRMARVMSIAGRVEVGAETAHAGTWLSSTQDIRTETGLACIAITDSITTCLDENSEALLALEDPRHFAVRLIRGRLVARLDKQPSTRTFRVETPKVAVIAKGTLFSVTLDAEHATTVRLHEGHVALQTASNQSGELIAPSRAIIQRGIEIKDWSELAAAEDQRLLGLSSLPRSGKRIRLDVLTQPAGASVDVDGVTLGPTPVSAFLTRGSRLSVTLAGYSPVTELLPLEGKDRVERSFELAAVDTKPVVAEEEARSVPANAPATATPSSLLARAQTLRSQGKYRECAAAYRQLLATFPRSDEARVSLVSLGELELSELGQPGQALQSFDGYLRAGGPLTREARYGRIRALQILGRNTEQQSAIADFIRDYPNSVQAASLRKRIQTKP